MADAHDHDLTQGTGATGAEGESRAGADAEGTPGRDSPAAGTGDAIRFPMIVPARPALREDATIIDEWPAPRRGDTHAAPRWMEWLRSRAAVIAVAAATGAVVGVAATAGIGHVFAGRGDAPGADEAVEALRTSVGQLANEIAALKAGVGEGSRAALDGLAAIEDRVAAAETAQADLAGEVAGLAKGLTRQAVAAAGPQVSNEVTGSIARGDMPVAQDWVLWRVRNGRALVQGNGGYFEVVPGSQLPGLGLVQRIVKSDGRWMVLTRNGAIVARG